jgi:two-component system cell cycle response regulator CtrA
VRILLIEDAVDMAQTIQIMLKTEGHVVEVANDAETGIDMLSVCNNQEYEYDVIILDLMLPGDVNGYDLIKKVRAQGDKTPILILSQLTEVNNKIKGFSIGADDYLPKPFNKRELLARINAIVRRYRGHSHSIIQTGRLKINLETKTAYVGNDVIPLSNKEFAILELLSIRKGITLTKETLLNHLYNGMDEPELKIVDVFICKLRKKLQVATEGERYIETVWGRGYVLRDPSAVDAQAEINLYQGVDTTYKYEDA